MSVGTILRLHDLDLMASEARDSKALTRLKKSGFPPLEASALERARALLLSGVDPRWLFHYERAMRRYGKAVAVVRHRVCQGCHVTLPTAISPGTGVSLTLCESCGRILYWP